jgi:hypothetical protein
MRAVLTALFLVALLAGCGGDDQSDSDAAGNSQGHRQGPAKHIVHDCLEATVPVASSHQRLVGPIKKAYRRCVNRRVHDAVKDAEHPRSVLKKLGHL